MLKKVKQTDRGKKINQNGIDKLKKALANGEIFYSAGNRKIFQVLSDDEKYLLAWRLPTKCFGL